CLKAFKLTLSVGFLFAVDTFTSFLRPVLTGIVWRVMSQTHPSDCYIGGETAGNVHYLSSPDKSFVIICYI
ncbi:hypothetical protein WI617_12905, partial [Salmonella enterica subsp. enterica serovar Corvallis]